MHLKNLAHMQSYFSGDLRRSSLEEWIMKLVTDIKLIEKLAAEKEDHNWRFRCFLKGADIDIVFHICFAEVIYLLILYSKLGL